jgi:NADH-quinone oxidoreductase subunit G
VDLQQGTRPREDLRAGRARRRRWLAGAPVALDAAIDAARELLASALRPAALVSSWGSNEELAAFERAFGSRLDCRVKDDWQPQPGEVVEDDFLIRADKNPNNAAAKARFASWDGTFRPAPTSSSSGAKDSTSGASPASARVICLDGYANEMHRAADVFIPITLQTERRGHYTNFEGKVGAFEPCF